MKGLAITIVDILGIFVPGLMILLGLVCFPPVAQALIAFVDNSQHTQTLLPVDRVTVAVGVVVASYILGFLNRLESIRLLQSVSRDRWTRPLRELASTLDSAFEAGLNNKTLSEALKSLAVQLGEGDPAFYAPYFHFAKRIVRATPGLWAEAERLEADVRFTAGLLFPLALIAADGTWMAIAHRSFLAFVVAVTAGTGVTIVLKTFPRRRIREVLYNYHLALVAFRQPVNRASEPNV